MPRDGSFTSQLRRTLVELLIDLGQRELAAAIIDGGVEVIRDQDGRPYGLTVEIPPSAYRLISENNELKAHLVKAAKVLAQNQFYDEDRLPVTDPEIALRLKL